MCLSATLAAEVNDGMHHRLLAIHTDVRLGSEVPLLALLRLMHLGIALAARVLRRTGRMNNRRVYDGAGADADDQLNIVGLRGGLPISLVVSR
jgi:hypothetical protein